MSDEMSELLMDCANAIAELAPPNHAYQRIALQAREAAQELEGVESALIDVCGRYHFAVIDLVNAHNSGDLDEITVSVQKIRELAERIQASCK